MNRDVIVSNKICFQKEIERDYQIHKQHVETSKPVVDKEEPNTIHLMNRPKVKNAHDLGRMYEVDRENEVLLSKIKEIMQKGSTLQKSQTISNVSGKLFQKPSLNSEVRKKNLVKIVIENQSILKRIQEKKSVYDINKLIQDRRKTEKIINNMSLFKYKNFEPTKTQIKYGIWDNDKVLQPKTPQVQSQLSFNKSLENFNQHPSSTANQRNKNIKLEPLQNEKPHSRPKYLKKANPQKLLYNKARKVGLDFYFVEIKIIKGIFIINLDNLEKANNKYQIEMEQDEAQKFLNKVCEGNYDFLIDRIRIDERNKTIFLKRQLDNQNQQERLNQVEEEFQDARVIEDDQGNQKKQGGSQSQLQQIQQNKKNQVKKHTSFGELEQQQQIENEEQKNQKNSERQEQQRQSEDLNQQKIEKKQSVKLDQPQNQKNMLESEFENIQEVEESQKLISPNNQLNHKQNNEENSQILSKKSEIGISQNKKNNQQKEFENYNEEEEFEQEFFESVQDNQIQNQNKTNEIKKETPEEYHEEEDIPQIDDQD